MKKRTKQRDMPNVTEKNRDTGSGTLKQKQNCEKRGKPPKPDHHMDFGEQGNFRLRHERREVSLASKFP